ncbi:hypothetical protein BD779DRAFT_1668436 [Infundibulicybe gibba]|nr:hypothetical protein BD779DRAFT_1668436 [Infundibulicybe gibba]
MLTGIGSPTFELAVKAADEIYDIFHREFPEGRLERWQSERHGAFTGLAMSNRYFTPKRDAPDMIHIPFGTTIDPRGILENMRKEGYVHGEENEVMYYNQQTNQGHTKFVKANPQIFRVGDIVEVQVSFIVVLLKKEKYKMAITLRAVAMLDGSFSQAANKKRADSREAPVLNIRPVLKRRVGYEMAEQGGKKAHMEVDEAQ